MAVSFKRRALLATIPLAWAGYATAAMAATSSFDVALSGDQQVPPVQTAGKGSAHLTYNPSTRVVHWDISYSGLSSPATMAHFHTGAAGKNGPVSVWLSKKGKPVSSPITGSAKLTPAQAKAFMAGDMYVNVHTKDHPAGEIRGQVMPPKA